MNIFTQKLLSIYFIALPIYIIFLVVIKVLRRRTIDKTIEALGKLPDDRKARISRLYKRTVSAQRIILWIIPFGFLLIIVAFMLLFTFPDMVLVFPEIDIRQLVLLMGILFIIMFIHLIEDSDYKKKILKAIDKSSEREIS
jgi:hypothetical protein